MGRLEWRLNKPAEVVARRLLQGPGWKMPWRGVVAWAAQGEGKWTELESWGGWWTGLTSGA